MMVTVFWSAGAACLTAGFGSGSDVAALALTTLTRFFAPALRLLGDVVTRPHLSAADLIRVRELCSELSC